MGNKDLYDELNKDGGQSTVEYILLLAVIATLVTTLVKSEKFQEVFGEDSLLIDNYKSQLEYSYRHGLSGREHFSEPNYSSGKHDTFTSGNSSRFFSSKDAYP